MLLWGVAAVGGSVGILGAPDGSVMSWDTDWLVHTPFADWLVPGLLLLGVGLVSLAAGALLVRDLRRRTPDVRHAVAVLVVAVVHVGWIAGEVAFLWGPVRGTDPTTRQFFHVFWAVYVPWALLDLVLAAVLLRTRGRFARGPTRDERP
jgi:hypothetical protein